MTIRGVFEKASGIETVGELNFKKRYVRLNIGQDGKANYAQLVLVGDKVAWADDLQPGQELEVSFFISGRIWQKDFKTDVVIQELQVTKMVAIKKQNVSMPQATGAAVKDEQDGNFPT